MKHKSLVITIFIVAFILRSFNITTNPPALYGDELTINLDAYSIAKTGHDQTGAFLPLTFSMGAGRPAGYVYGSIPFVYLFGPTALGVRSLSILSGMGIVILLYLLGRKIFDDKLGVVAAAIGAVSPWDIALSRGGFETHFALFLALVGIYCFIKAKEKPLFYIYSAVSFGLTLHTYPTYKLTLPIFLCLLFWFQGGKKIINFGKKYFLTGMAIFLILVILSISQTFIGNSEERFSNINILSQGKLKAEIEQKINFERTITNLPTSISKYFHNKGVEYAKVLIENYLENFSMDFLFIHGDRNPRHNMATMGEFYLADGLLILIGILNLWKNKKIILFLLLWIILSPIPTAFVGNPHALRSAFMLPPIIFLSACGLITILNKKNKIVIGVLATVFIIQFIFFTQKLYFLAPKEYSNFWAYDAKQASEQALQDKKNYDFIFLSDKIDNIEFAYPVYAKIEPLQIIEQNKTKFSINGLKFKKFDNIYIGNIPEEELDQFLENVDKRTLFIGPNNLSTAVLTTTQK